jgi:hypothetical protein
MTTLLPTGRRVACWTLLASLLTSDALAQSAPPARSKGSAKRGAPVQAPVEVARVGFMEGGVEVQKPGAEWTKAREDQPLSIGDRVRTLKGATAQLEFPWTAIAVGDGSSVFLQKKRVLTLQLESGRIDIDPEQALLRVITEEASISGTGRTLVRREGTTTFVGSYNGGAEVAAKGAAVRLGVNKGTVVNRKARPSDALDMTQAPRVLSPTVDPRYVRRGEVVRLTWNGREPAYHLEVLAIDSDVPVLSIDIEGQEFDLRLNWLGTFRWRVSGRTGPVESQTSGEGLICVVEK